MMFLARDGAPKNPFLAKIDAAAVDLATAERREREERDAFLLADAAVNDITRRMREGQEIHNSQGMIVIDRKTGRPITDEEIARADRRRDEAESTYMIAAAAASKARGQLHNAEKAAENWETTAAYLASQARDEAALTPAERGTRARRDACQRDLVARSC